MSFSVPSKDYRLQYQQLWPELGPELERVFHEENPVLGESVGAFEREFANYVGVKHAVGVGSGTAALVLAMRSLEIGPGDEVITAANTFAATVTAIMEVGARPVLVDPDPETLTLDAQGVAGAISDRTKAVIPVHLYGRLCSMPPLLDLCVARGVDVIEDAAQAHGARSGRSAGAFGRLGCFSFHPSKNLGAFGDGGAITTDDEDLAQTLREMRNLGKRTKYEFVRVAPNTKLDTVQAAVLRIKLRHLDQFNARRREIARDYVDRLRPHQEPGRLELPPMPLDEETDQSHVFHLFAAHTDHRDDLRQFLKSRGINAGVHYPVPPHLQPATVDLGYRQGDFPVAEGSALRELSLPVSPELTSDQISFVCDEIHDFFTN